MVVENLSGKVQYSQNLDEKEIEEIINLGKQLNVPMMLYSKQAHISETIPEIVLKNKNSKGINYRVEKFNNIDFKNEADYIYKIAFIDKPEKILQVRKRIPKHFIEKYEVTSSVPEYIEFVKKGIKKSEAIKFVINKLNITPEEVIAIGDGENDIEMLKFAGLGVAMENANDCVKSNANFITTSNNNDGVGNVVEKFILNE